MKWNKIKATAKAGFTLIELLVVITIIGILATGATATYTSQIQKARDTTRINDIKALQSWVEQVYQDTSEYPTESGDAAVDGTFAKEVVIYVPKIPSDPKATQACNKMNGNSPCDYYYDVWSDLNGIANGVYRISSWFENSWNVKNKAAKDGGIYLGRMELGLNITNTADVNSTQPYAAETEESAEKSAQETKTASCMNDLTDTFLVRWACPSS